MSFRIYIALVIGVAASMLLNICHAGEDIDLRRISTSGGSFKISGATDGDNIGKSVSSAGDFNDDGYPDVIVGSYESGTAYVIFGGQPAENVDLLDFESGENGFKIIGADGDHAGISVSGGGDLNGDGIDDIIVGTPGSANGTAYVLYGQSHSTTTFETVNLQDFTSGTAGIIINGPSVGSSCGELVNNAGDVNGDGVADILVTTADTVYVIFGSSSNSLDMYLHDFRSGAHGFKVVTTEIYVASGIGDVNNDGYADVIMSVSDTLYVVFGGASIVADIEVDTSFITGETGFKVTGISADAGAPSAGKAGDVNADGIQDLILSIGAVDDDSDPAAFVIYGQSTANTVDVDLSTFTAADGKGFKMTGCGDEVVVNGAGDVNADGIDDIIVLCPPDYGFVYGAGTSFVLFGRNHNTSSFGDLDLSTFKSGRAGVRILGSAAADDIGYYAVSSAGDMNGDGYADVIIGATAVNAFGRTASGAAYVVDGQSVTRASTHNKKKTVDGDRIGALVGGICGLLLVMYILYRVKYDGPGGICSSGYGRAHTADPSLAVSNTGVVPV